MAVAVIEKADSELSRVVLEDGEVISIATIQLNLTQPNLIFMLKFCHIWSAAITNDDLHVR